jgi:hypothetical protein
MVTMGMRKATLPPVERRRLWIGDNNRRARIRHALWSNNASFPASEEETVCQTSPAAGTKHAILYFPADVAGNNRDTDPCWDVNRSLGVAESASKDYATITRPRSEPSATQWSRQVRKGSIPRNRPDSQETWDCEWGTGCTARREERRWDFSVRMNAWRHRSSLIIQILGEGSDDPTEGTMRRRPREPCCRPECCTPCACASLFWAFACHARLAGTVEGTFLDIHSPLQDGTLGNALLQSEDSDIFPLRDVEAPLLALLWNEKTTCTPSIYR